MVEYDGLRRCQCKIRRHLVATVKNEVLDAIVDDVMSWAFTQQDRCTS